MDSNLLFIIMVLAGSAAASPANLIGVTPTNSNISCNWETPSGLVGDIQTDKLNVTDIVAQCAYVCDFAFASGIPEIAKIGVWVSIFIQLVVVCLFGPLFPILIRIITSCSSPTLIRSIPFLRKLQRSAWEANGLFCITILVATIVLGHQSPSILEITFASQVLNLQLMLIISLIWSQMADDWMKQSKDSKLGWTWSVYSVVLFASAIGSTYAVSLPGKTTSVYKQLAKSCHDQQNLVDLSSNIGSGASGISVLKYLGIGLAIGVVIGVVLIAAAATFANIWMKILSVIPKWLQSHGFAILISVALMFYMACSILDIIVLADFRQTWQKMSGDLFQDDDWGYGQTTAILIWAPFVWANIKETIKYWREPLQAEQTQAEIQTLDPEAHMPQAVEMVPPPYSPQKRPA